MIIYPAIDLYSNRVVRLYQGKYDRKTEYGTSPLDLAKKFIELGASWLHIVDLEGAEKGYPIHLGLAEEIASMGIKVQMGGGLRSIHDIERTLKGGILKVYVGSLLAKDSEAARELYDRWESRIIPAVDIKNDTVAISGWKETSDKEPSSFLATLHKTGYRDALVTSITRDGTFQGPDIPLYKKIMSSLPGLNIIAAGGIASMDDVMELKKAGCSGAVLGKSLYDGRVDLKELLEAMN